MPNGPPPELIRNLRLNGTTDPRVRALESVFDDYRRMLPAYDAVDWFAECVRLNKLLRDGHHTQVRADAGSLLARMSPDQADYPQLLRITAEACVHLGDWAAARDVVARFTEAAHAGTLRRFDTATLVRNVGGACLIAMLHQHDEAFELFRALHRIMDLADEHGMVVQAGDRDVIAVQRALLAYLDNDETTCATWLDRADLDDIDAVERIGFSRLVHRLLRNWSADKSTHPGSADGFEAPEKVADLTFGSSPHPVPDTVLPLDDDSMIALLLEQNAASAPVRAAGSIHVARTGGQLPREPLEAAVETCLALRVLGLPAEIIEVGVQVLRDGPGIVMSDPEKLVVDNPANAHLARIPHHAVWVPSSKYLVDPALPQRYAIRAAAMTRPSHRHPVVLPFSPTTGFPTLRREGLLVTYTGHGTYEPRDVAMTLAPDRRAICESNALFIALQALLSLAMTGDRRVSEIEAAYPQLAGLIFRPQQLMDLR